MRGLALILTLTALLPVALRFPFVGVYLWEWVTLMNPHRLVAGFAQDLPFNMVVAAVTIGAWLFSKERGGLRWNALTILILVFSAWITITTAMAPTPDASWPLWSRNIKTMVLLLVIMALITSQTRLHGLIWVIVISLGYYGVKGGGFMVLTAGNNIVFGPTETMIEDNNSLALALIITLPLMNYLRLNTAYKGIRMALIGAMLLTAAAAIGTYSRGAVIAFAVMLLLLWWKSRAKLAISVMGALVLVGALTFMPQKFMDRVNTINQAGEDSSFQGRLDAWGVAWHTALQRPFGAGFDGPRQDIIWKKYSPDTQPRASHSIYFMVLGEHGFIGLFLYLAICFAAWRNLKRVVSVTRDKPELSWARDLAGALQVSIAGFMVGGAALPMAYYDGFLTLIAASAVLRHLVVAEEEAAPVRTPLPHPLSNAASLPHGGEAIAVRN